MPTYLPNRSSMSKGARKREFIWRRAKAATGFRKLAAVYRGRRYRRGLPARGRFSNSRYFGNKTFAKKINNFAETNIIQTNPFNNVTPEANVNGKTQRIGFILQDRPSSWDSTLKDMGGILINSGVGPNQRIGNYVYYKKTHVSLHVDMTFTTSPKPPIQFRFLILKSKQSVMPAGRTELPDSSIFLTNTGKRCGYLTTGDDVMTAMDYDTAPLNKRDWVVFRDQRFILSHPIRSDSDGGNVGYSGKYPIRKNLVCNLNHFKKVRLDSNNAPEDYDAHYLVYVFATSIGDANDVADNWSVSMRGTTSYADL